MTDAPPERGTAVRTAARALVTGIGIALLVAAIGQAIGLGLYLVQGASGSHVPYARLGAVYVQLFHHADVSARLGAVGRATPLTLDVRVALMLVTAAAAMLLARAARRLADTSPTSVLAGTVALAAGYAIIPLLLALVARGRVALPRSFDVAGSVDVTVPALSSFVLPFAVAVAAGALGALSAPIVARAGRDSTGPTVADVVLGGCRSVALALLLSVGGALVLGSVQPSLLRAYLSVLGAPNSASGRTIAVGHAVLLLPNQAMWVLVPAMGACDEVVVDGDPTPFLCYWREPTEIPIVVDAGVAPSSRMFRRPPGWYLGFLVVPIVATGAGGARAARGAPSARVRAACGAASGIVFAGLIAASITLARIDLRVAGSLLGSSDLRLALGPELLRGTALAAAWGVAGGIVGGLLSPRLGGGARASAE